MSQLEGRITNPIRRDIQLYNDSFFQQVKPKDQYTGSGRGRGGGGEGGYRGGAEEKLRAMDWF